MRPWMIVLSGLISALIFAAGSLWPEALAVPRSDLVWIAVQHVPQLLPATFAVYAALVLLLTTGGIIVEISRVHRRLKAISARPRDGWIMAFARTGVARLSTRILHLVPAELSPSNDKLIVEAPFEAGKARHEIVRLYQDWLARGHFFTALALLIGFAAVGMAQEYGLLTMVRMTISTTPIEVGFLGLVFLAVCGRFAVEAAAEPLLDTIAQLPLQHFEFVRHYSDGVSPQSVTDVTSLGPPQNVALDQAAQALARELLRVRRSFDKAVAQLSVSAKAIALAGQALTEQSQHPTVSDPVVLRELQVAIDRLTATIGELPPMPRELTSIEGESITSDSGFLVPRFQREETASRELRQLLEDLD